MRRFAITAIILFLVSLSLAPLSKGADSSGGEFLVQCGGPVRSAPDDPIVGGASHLHEFYGNRTINLNSTYESLRAGATACGDPHDTASYWHPTLYVRGERVPLPKSTAYYSGHGKSTPLSTWPAGLRIIAGDSKANAPQPTSVVYWGCGNGSSVSKVNYVPQCKSGDTGLTVHVIFPNCWNGRDLDSPDHKSHMTYSSGSCPSGFPVSLPRLIMRWQWTHLTPAPGNVTLASCNTGTCGPTGSPNTMHSDWINAWDQPTLAALVDQCINAGKDCPAGTKVSTGSTTTTLPTTTTVRATTTTSKPPPTTTTTVACGA